MLTFTWRLRPILQSKWNIEETQRAFFYHQPGSHQGTDSQLIIWDTNTLFQQEKETN